MVRCVAAAWSCPVSASCRWPSRRCGAAARISSGARSCVRRESWASSTTLTSSASRGSSPGVSTEERGSMRENGSGNHSEVICVAGNGSAAEMIACVFADVCKTGKFSTIWKHKKACLISTERKTKLSINVRRHFVIETQKLYEVCCTLYKRSFITISQRHFIQS